MGNYKNTSLTSRERAEALLGLMTLEEKIAQINIARGAEFGVNSQKTFTCSIAADDEMDYAKIEKTFGDRGIGYVHDIYAVPKILNKMQRYFVEKTRLGIPCIFTGEALHGVSYSGASIFPVPLNLGAAFDPALTRRVGGAIAAETRALGINEILAPNLDVARDPRWGRTEETFGEDTYLSSRMAEAIISGEQHGGELNRGDAVISEPKHYCVHGIAEGGLNCAPARAGRREIETSYLPVFEAGIKNGGAYNVMACYNCIDGEAVMTSRYYLTEVLKNKLGLRGISRADWGGVKRIVNSHHLTRDHNEAVRMALDAGLDMQGCCDYESGEWERIVKKAVLDGKLDADKIDESVRRILTMKFELGLFEHPYTDEDNYRAVLRCDAHKSVSLDAARESIVLLKNDGVLPLAASVKRIALLGPSSDAQKTGGYSSVPSGYKVNSIYDELKAMLPGAEIAQCGGCGITENGGSGDTVYIDGQPHLTKTLDKAVAGSIAEAVEAAERSELAIIVCGDNNVTSGEGADRCQLALYGRQRELILKVAQTGKPVVLVLENGKPVELSAETAAVGAIIAAGFGGEFGARAIAEVITGAYNPGGRLPISYPAYEGALPCYYSMLPGGSSAYLETPKRTLYPFGHGLSYTAFEYSELKITRGEGYACGVSLKVKNTGAVKGDEVVQLYINDIDSSVVTPLKLLKGFKRIALAPGEEATVAFALDFDSFKLLDAGYNWVVEPGEFELMLGSSSEDIRLRGSVTM